jgi:DNA-binding NtrC family response regulator
MKNILMVHDDEILTNTAVGYLKRKGYNAVGIHNRQEAINYIQDNKPDLVLFGLYFADLSDIDFLKELRKKHPQVPVWVFKNLLHDDIEKELTKLKPEGYLDFIIKMDELLKKIGTFFNENAHKT